MIVRELHYLVDINDISPKAEQNGGLQGDHNVTKIIYTLEENLLSVISQIEDGDIKYRIQVTDGAGGFYSTDLLVLSENQISFDIPDTITAAGGVSYFYLIISKIITNENETISDNILYSFPAKIRFSNTSTSGTTSEADYAKDISSALTSAKAAAQSAKNSESVITESLQEAKTTLSDLSNQNTIGKTLTTDLSTSITDGNKTNEDLKQTTDSSRHLEQQLSNENYNANIHINSLEKLLGDSDSLSVEVFKKANLELIPTTYLYANIIEDELYPLIFSGVYTVDSVMDGPDNTLDYEFASGRVIARYDLSSAPTELIAGDKVYIELNDTAEEIVSISLVKDVKDKADINYVDTLEKYIENKKANLEIIDVPNAYGMNGIFNSEVGEGIFTIERIEYLGEYEDNNIWQLTFLLEGVIEFAIPKNIDFSFELSTLASGKKVYVKYGEKDLIVKSFVDVEDKANKVYVDNIVGDIETALDEIIELQNSLIGGESV